MSTRKKVDVSKWRKMMKPRYEQIRGFREQKMRNNERMAREKTALRRHVEMKLKYGNEGPAAAKKIQESFKNYMKFKKFREDVASKKIHKAFKNFMGDIEKIKKRQEARLAKEANNLLKNLLKPKLKRERNSKNTNANRGPSKRVKKQS